MSDRRIPEFVTLSAFSRYSTESERAMLGASIGPRRPPPAVEDMVWAMLPARNSFNH